MCTYSSCVFHCSEDASISTSAQPPTNSNIPHQFRTESGVKQLITSEALNLCAVKTTRLLCFSCGSSSMCTFAVLKALFPLKDLGRMVIRTTNILWASLCWLLHLIGHVRRSWGDKIAKYVITNHATLPRNTDSQGPQKPQFYCVDDQGLSQDCIHTEVISPNSPSRTPPTLN